ncbi:MAG: hypothetical protein MZW92_18740 [Comamonadaceae bacterium]|nr:hypothetical protein [Comamonadaceae bacterium]
MRRSRRRRACRRARRLRSTRAEFVGRDVRPRGASRARSPAGCRSPAGVRRRRPASAPVRFGFTVGKRHARRAVDRNTGQARAARGGAACRAGARCRGGAGARSTSCCG